MNQTPIVFDIDVPDYLATTVLSFQARTNRLYAQQVVDFHNSVDEWLKNATEAVAAGHVIPQAPTIPVKTIWGIKDGALASYPLSDPALVIPPIPAPPVPAGDGTQIRQTVAVPPDRTDMILSGVRDIQARLAKAGM